MSLSVKYHQFRSSPDASALADKASINYITTLVTINEPAAVLKHLSAQAKQLNKKEERVLSTIEGDDGLCLEVETTLEFVSGGGAFLPGLDDNFLADRTVTLPVVHIVQFDAQQKIHQIRLHWDQGSLLKQIEVIGARARNWPIRDGRDQTRLIASSVSLTSSSTATASSRPTTSLKHPNEVTITSIPHSNGNRSQDANEQGSSSTSVAPRASAKPPSRGLTEILAADDAPSSSSAIRSSSPQKAGAGKHFQSNRLFDENDAPATVSSPEKLKTNSQKYDHFEFGDGDEPQLKPPTKQSKRSSTHAPKWDFEDFVTPEKVPTKIRDQDVRNFGWSDNEDVPSPVKRPIVHHARPDAEAHFELADDGTPAADRKPHTAKGRMHNKGLGLYEDHIFGDSDGEDAGTRNGKSGAGAKHDDPSTITSISAQSRHKDFDAHFDINDDSSAATRNRDNGAIDGNGHGRVPEDRKKVVKSLNANWGLYEQSPARQNVHRGIKTGGDGMGGRKDVVRSWGLGDESDEEAEREASDKRERGRVAREGREGRGQVPAQSEATKDFWDF